jgi:F-type H+-transporting ATPase subunit gamma
MHNLNEIKRHIRSVEQTRKITNAMYLLSTSRMRRAITNAAYNNEYFMRVRSTVKGILARSKGIRHPYLEDRGSARAVFIVVAGDKSLCGPYNDNILDFAFERIRRHSKRYLVTIGIVATHYFVKNGIVPDLELIGVAQNPSLTDARNIIEQVFEMYDQNQMDEVFVISTRFVNTLNQYPRAVRLLPLEIEDYGDVSTEADVDVDEDILFEPSAQVVFNTLVPQYAIGLLYGSLVQAVASEHCARMNAMQKATTNADDMIRRLRVEYNSARQFTLTQEIGEISAAANAIRGEEL